MRKLPASSNRCFLVTTGIQKPPVRVSKQPGQEVPGMTNTLPKTNVDPDVLGPCDCFPLPGSGAFQGRDRRPQGVVHPYACEDTSMMALVSLPNYTNDTRTLFQGRVEFVTRMCRIESTTDDSIRAFPSDNSDSGSPSSML